MLCANLDGWAGGGWEGGPRGRGDIYIYDYIYIYIYTHTHTHIHTPISDSPCCTAETNTLL